MAVGLPCRFLRPGRTFVAKSFAGSVLRFVGRRGLKGILGRAKESKCTACRGMTFSLTELTRFSPRNITRRYEFTKVRMPGRGPRGAGGRDEKGRQWIVRIGVGGRVQSCRRSVFVKLSLERYIYSILTVLATVKVCFKVHRVAKRRVAK